VSWLALSLALLGVVLVAGFAWFESSRPSARVVALVASLAALAVLGRIAFAPLPNVKPTTDIVLLTGYALGGAPGFAVGAVAAFASNLFFGQGPWTPWQMVGWGGVGVLGALLARATPGRGLGRWGLAGACALAGLAFGALMNVGLWLSFTGEPSPEGLLVLAARSAPFDLAHALGNVVFCLLFGPALVTALRRFQARLDVDWRPAPAPAALGAALLGLLVAAAAPPAAEAQAPRASVRWLERAQNADGGFGAAPRQASTGLHTGWAALGLAAAGRPTERAVAWVRRHPRELSDLGALERTVLLLGATRTSPRRFAGRDLVAELVARRRRDGSFGGRVNTTAFGVLALRAAGVRSLERSTAWIAAQANRDGGFNFAGRGGPSGIDDTGAALQALVAGGRSRRSAVVRRAASFLARRQNPDGGFPLAPGGASNAQSTAWAVQGLLAAGRAPERVRRGGARDPLSYLRSLVAPSGLVRYSRTSEQTPVWVTAQALTALARRPFPLPRPRARRAAAAAAPAPARTPEPAARRAPARPRTPSAAAPRAARRPPAPPALRRLLRGLRDREGARRLGLLLGGLGRPVL